MGTFFEQSVDAFVPVARTGTHLGLVYTYIYICIKTKVKTLFSTKLYVFTCLMFIYLLVFRNFALTDSESDDAICFQ
jgi:hypothetical protein